MKLNHRFESLATRVFNPSSWLSAIKRKTVQLATLAINLLLLTTILAMADHLPFVDVPSGAFYHNAVSALYGARITTGTTPTTFSPDDLVTRGQMAVFLHRGLGRIAYDFNDTSVNLSTEDVKLAEVALFITGGVSGGTGFMKLDGVINSRIFTSENTSGCPCQIEFYIVQVGRATSRTSSTNLLNSSGGVTGKANGAVTFAVSVPTGTFQTFQLWGKISRSAGSIPSNETTGHLTAIYAPFGKFGNNTLAAISPREGDATPAGARPDGKPDPRHVIQAEEKDKKGAMTAGGLVTK